MSGRPEASDPTGTPMREYHYLVDREGRIYHEGSELSDPPLLRFFLRAMQETADHRFLVVCQGERNWFEVDGTPFVVQRLRPVLEDGRLAGVELCFAGDHREALDPATLETEADSLYCRVRRGAFRARFGRAAMHQLAPFLEEDADRLALRVGGRQYPVRPRGAGAHDAPAEGP